MLAFGRTLIYVVEIEIEIEIGPRPTSRPSFVLIHPAVWPQYTNVADSQTDRTGQRSDSVGRYKRSPENRGSTTLGTVPRNLLPTSPRTKIQQLLQTGCIGAS